MTFVSKLIPWITKLLPGNKSVCHPVSVDGKEYFGFSQKGLSIDDAKRLAEYEIDGDRYGIVLCVPGLSDDAAEALSHCKRWLFLPHLTSLGDGPGHLALARKLGTQGIYSSPEPLDLSGLTTISADAAKEIALFNADDLLLNGLTELTDDTAKFLAESTGPRLFLNGVLELSDIAASWLAKYQGDEIHMRGLTRLSSGVGHVALAVRLLSQGSRSYNADCLQEVSAERKLSDIKDT